MATLTKKDLLEAIKDMPNSLYSGGLYIKYDLNGLWYCGYNGSVFHSSDRDLAVALDNLFNNLKASGYDIEGI